VSGLEWQELASWVPTSDVTDLTYYRAGAQLVRYLIDKFGVPAVMQYYRSAPASTQPEEVDRELVAAFGESLADAWDGALQLSLPGGPCLTPFECSQPAIEVGESWSVEARCGVGYSYRTLELTEDTALVLAAPAARDRLGERDSLDMLLACDGLASAPTWTSVYPPRLATRLVPGRYALVLPRPEVDLTLEVAAFRMEASCEPALDASLILERGETLLAVPHSQDELFVALTGATTESADISAIGPAGARLCADCAEQACSELGAAPMPVKLVGAPVLVVDSADADAPFDLFSLQGL
jgi:hypothetical protein